MARLDPMMRANSMPVDATLRQRKQLPPLASSPTELSMDSLSPTSDPVTNDSNTSPIPKADNAQLLRNHVQFAKAFKLNDAAQLLPFLHKNVTLTTLDGHVIRGTSAVLGFLVGAKMSKLSGGVHVKQAKPTRCGDWQTVFVYEHGLVFKEPLYSEAMEWQPDATGVYVATRITHMWLSHTHENNSSKSVADVAKVVAALPHRLSLSSDEDESGATTSPRASLSRRSGAPASTTNSACISTTANCTDLNIGAIVTRVAVATKLSPIRKRKLVNAFLTVESADGILLWKSSVAKKQLLPVWRGIDLEFPPPLDEQVVVTLWDYGLFRSLRVATAHTSAAQLLQHERGGIASLELKSMGLASSSVELSFSITRLSDDRAWRPRSASIVSTVAAIDAAMADYDEDDESTLTTTAFVQKVSFGRLSVDMDTVWLMSTSAFGLVLICLALLWLHSSGQLVAK